MLSFIPRSLLALLCLYSTLSLAEDIVWLSEWHVSENKTLTIDEQTRDLIINEMTGFSVTLQQTPSSRALMRLRDENNVCVSDRVFNNERAEYSLVSDLPQVVVPGLKFYLLDTFINKHNISPKQLSELSLPEILTRYPNMRLGTVADRSYGKVIDNVLIQDNLASRLWKRSSSDMGEGIIEMLASERIDAVFEYPPLFEKVRQQKALSVGVQAISIQGIPKFGVGFVLCSRSPEGERAIAAVSKSLAELTKQRAYLDIHLSAMPQDYREEMLTYYNQIYGTDFTLEIKKPHSVP